MNYLLDRISIHSIVNFWLRCVHQTINVGYGTVTSGADGGAVRLDRSLHFIIFELKFHCLNLETNNFINTGFQLWVQLGRRYHMAVDINRRTAHGATAVRCGGDGG